MSFSPATVEVDVQPRSHRVQHAAVPAKAKFLESAIAFELSALSKVFSCAYTGV